MRYSLWRPIEVIVGMPATTLERLLTNLCTALEVVLQRLLNWLSAGVSGRALLPPPHNKGPLRTAFQQKKADYRETEKA